MGAHLVNGKFQSDKYPTCPPGKVPLSVEDPMAQDLLWIYSLRRLKVDKEFSIDLETALRDAGFQGCDDSLIQAILRDVCELGDRTSPEHDPDQLIVTGEELSTILERHLWHR